MFLKDISNLHFDQPTTQAALVAVIRMGVFKAFGGKEQMSAAEIATEFGADRILLGNDLANGNIGDDVCLIDMLVRLMRALLVNNIFEEVDEENYAQNALQRTFGDKEDVPQAGYKEQLKGAI